MLRSNFSISARRLIRKGNHVCRCGFSSFSNNFDVLTPYHKTVMSEERMVFQKLHKALCSIDAPNDILELVRDSHSRIDDMFMMVVVGEFNSGKSTFINSLVGKKILKDGILPTTDKICILRTSAPTTDNSAVDAMWRKSSNMILDDVVEMDLHVDWLPHMCLIDTPGTNAIAANHEQLTQKIVPRADLVLFVTSAERPFSDSESKFMEVIGQWGKKVIIIVNKCDLLENHQGDRQKVMDFVSQNSARILGGLDVTSMVPIFGISARSALKAKLLAWDHDLQHLLSVGSADMSGEDIVEDNDCAAAAADIQQAWSLSNMSSLEGYLRTILKQDDLIKDKLRNPLGIADRIVQDMLTNQLKVRQEQLISDQRILEMINANMDVFNEDLQRDVSNTRTKIRSLFSLLIERADAFFDEKISVTNPSFLWDADTLKKEFSKQVLLDMQQPIDIAIHDISALIIQRAQQQATHVLHYLADRPNEYAVKNMMIGKVEQTAIMNVVYKDILDKLRRDMKGVLMSTEDEQANVEKLSLSVRQSAVHAAFLQVSSVAAAGGLAFVHMLDFTGLLTASSVAVLGLVVVPWKKSSLRKDFKNNVLNMQKRVDGVLVENLTDETQQLNNQIFASFAPFSRFVTTETKRIDELNAEMLELRGIVHELRQKIEKM